MDLKVKQTRENSFGWLVKMLSQRIDRTMTDELKPLGLNPGLFATIMTLLEQEGINQTKLGNAIGVQGHTTTRNLDILEEMSLVKRCQDPDNRRIHRVFLTKEGKTLGKKLPLLVKKVNSNFLSALDENESTQVVEILKKVLNSADPKKT